MKLCRDCEHFEVIREPGPDLEKTGKAVCKVRKIERDWTSTGDISVDECRTKPKVAKQEKDEKTIKARDDIINKAVEICDACYGNPKECIGCEFINGMFIAMMAVIKNGRSK